MYLLRARQYDSAAAAAAAKSLQSGPTLCDPMDCSLLGSSVRGILQAKILEWVRLALPTLGWNLSLLYTTTEARAP